MEVKLIKAAGSAVVKVKTTLTKEMLQVVAKDDRTVFVNDKPVFVAEATDDASEVSDYGILVNESTILAPFTYEDDNEFNTVKFRFAKIKTYVDELESKVEEAYKALVESAKTIKVED